METYISCKGSFTRSQEIWLTDNPWLKCQDFSVEMLTSSQGNIPPRLIISAPQLVKLFPTTSSSSTCKTSVTMVLQTLYNEDFVGLLGLGELHFQCFDAEELSHHWPIYGISATRLPQAADVWLCSILSSVTFFHFWIIRGIILSSVRWNVLIPACRPLALLQYYSRPEIHSQLTTSSGNGLINFLVSYLSH